MTPEDRKALSALTFSLATVCALVLISWFEFKWSDPVGSLLAISAAFIGGYFINRQIRSSEKQAGAARTAKFLSARAALPLTLVAITEYARGCAAFLKPIYDARSGRGLTPVAAPPLPRIPEEAIHELRVLIEYGPPNIGGAIASMLGLIQVQRSRIQDVEAWNSGRPSPSVNVWNLEDYIVNTAEIYSRAANLFQFARFERDDPRPMDVAAIASGVRQLDFEAGEELETRINRWRPHYERQLP